MVDPNEPPHRSPPAAGCAEREITAAVDLCLPDGSLDPRAVGWSRHPLHRCNLRRRWLAKKRWSYWAAISETHLFSATVSDLDYAGVVFVYLADFARGEVRERTVVTPLGRGCMLPEHVAQAVAFRGHGLSLAFEPMPGGTRIAVAADDLGGAPLAADLVVETPPGHETLGVVVPWSRRTFQYTAKQTALAARGTVRHGEREIPFAGERSFACLDFGRGIWPRRCAWNWAAAAGYVGGRRVGVNLGGKWTDGTGSTENALCVDGRLSKVSEDLVWRYDRDHFLRPWRVEAPRTGAVDLTFSPFLERVAKSRFGPVVSEVHQLFGHFSGTLATAQSERLAVSDLLGWAEEHLARW